MKTSVKINGKVLTAAQVAKTPHLAGREPKTFTAEDIATWLDPSAWQFCVDVDYNGHVERWYYMAQGGPFDISLKEMRKLQLLKFP